MRDCKSYEAVLLELLAKTSLDFVPEGPGFELGV
jgi:hypothetical protein